MTPRAGAGPGKERSGPPQAAPVTLSATNKETVPHQADESWNAGRLLGQLLGLSVADWIDENGDDGFEHVDYHRDHLDLGWVEREEVGRELAIAGYRP